MTENPPEQTVQKGWALRFIPIWAGDALSVIATILVQFSLVWWFAQTTGSAAALAFGSVVGLVPSIVIGPFAGVLVDRWSRRVVMMIANACIALSTLILAVLFLVGTVELWHVYLILFARAIFNTFNFSALQATTSLMVPNQHLGRVAGLNQVMAAAANIGGPPLGALLLSLMPMPPVLMIDVAAALLAIVPLAVIAVPNPPKEPDEVEVLTTKNQVAGVWAEFMEGFHYVTTWRALTYFCLFAASINFLSAPLSALLPLLVTQYLGGEVAMLGTLTSAYGIGMLVGALILSVWGGFKRRIFTTMCGIIGTGAAVFLLGASPLVGFILALTASALIGIMGPISNGPITALLQSIVVPAKQGRVFNLITSIAGIAMPLGLIVAGPLADVIGLQVIFYAIGTFFILIALVAFSSPTLMNIEAQLPSQAVPQPAAEPG